MKIKFNDFINEEFILSFNAAGKDFVIFKNPESLDRIARYSRGLIDKEGNFFICYSPGDKDKISGITHITIIRHYCKMMNITDYSNWHEELPVDFLCVQRNDDTNDIYLSESYMYYDKVIPISYNFLKLAREKSNVYNPDLTFKNEKIPSGQWKR